jgi:hypothetical protein
MNDLLLGGLVLFCGIFDVFDCLVFCFVIICMLDIEVAYVELIAAPCTRKRRSVKHGGQSLTHPVLYRCITPLVHHLSSPSDDAGVYKYPPKAPKLTLDRSVIISRSILNSVRSVTRVSHLLCAISPHLQLRREMLVCRYVSTKVSKPVFSRVSQFSFCIRASPYKSLHLRLRNTMLVHTLTNTFSKSVCP